MGQGVAVRTFSRWRKAAATSVAWALIRRRERAPGTKAGAVSRRNSATFAGLVRNTRLCSSRLEQCIRFRR